MTSGGHPINPTTSAEMIRMGTPTLASAGRVYRPVSTALALTHSLAVCAIV